MGLTSTRTIRRCPWRLGYGSTPPLQGASHGRESLREFDAVRCDGPRYEPSSRQSARRSPGSVTGRSQTSPEEALDAFHGSSSVLSRLLRFLAIRLCRTAAQRANVMQRRLSTREQVSRRVLQCRQNSIAAARARASFLLQRSFIARQYLCSSHARRAASNRDS